jgi:ACS family hexuronate transporter-like MFS transporter
MASQSVNQQPILPVSQKMRAGRTRWWIVWTLFCSTAINYIRRQTFSVLSPVIAAQYHLTHTDLAKIIGAFQLSYALTWLIGGIFLDLVGTRIGLFAAVVWWSLVNIMMGFASSVSSFVAFRFMLGIGEGLNWPGASKTVAEWFPSEERSVAVAIFDSGSSVGGAFTALVIPWIALAFGWRWSFAFSGVLGFFWLFAWLRVYHPLDRHPRVSSQEVALIHAGQEVASQSKEKSIQRWLRLARNRNVWGIVLGRALTDPIWWFYVFWLPQYLSDARGFSLKQIAIFAWMPFVAADLGNFTGGADLQLLYSSRYIHSPRTYIGVRRELLADFRWHSRSSRPQCLCCISANLRGAMGYASWSTMGLTLPSDLFPQDIVATVTGLSGLAAGIAGVAFTFVVGITVDRFSYGPAFLVAGLLPLVATSLFILIDPYS